MATQSCESCKVQFAHSLSHCPSCGTIGRNIARQVELLNHEIQTLKSRIETYRVKKLACHECNTEIPVNSIIDMYLEERTSKGGFSGTVDTSGRVNINQDFIKDEKIICTYKGACPSCKSTDPFNGKSQSFVIDMNYDSVARFFGNLFSTLFVLAYRITISLFLAFIIALVVNPVSIDGQFFIFLSTIVILIPVSIFDKKMKDKIKSLTNYKRELENIFNAEKKGVELDLLKVRAASQFLPQSEAFMADLKSACINYIHYKIDDLNIRVDTNSQYFR
jgi:hypothetical protein